MSEAERDDAPEAPAPPPRPAAPGGVLGLFRPRPGDEVIRAGVSFPAAELRGPAATQAVDDELVQALPPLQGVPEPDRARAAAYWDALAAEAAARAPEARPRFGRVLGLDAEATARALAWAVAAARRCRLPAVDLSPPHASFARELVAARVAGVALAPTAASAAFLRGELARAVVEADRDAEEAARERAAGGPGWWAGEAEPPAEVEVDPHEAPPVVVGRADTPPLKPGLFSSVLALDALPYAPAWPEVVRRWLALLAPGGTLVLGCLAEKDQDEPSFLSALGRELWPGVVTGFPRSQDLTWVLGSLGLEVDSASVFRVRWTYEEIESQRGPAGGGDIGWRRIVDRASESLRALYDIDEEGMSWRYLLLKASKP